MKRVLDAHALFVYFDKEPGFELVSEALTRAVDTGNNLLLTAVNWGEVI